MINIILNYNNVNTENISKKLIKLPFVFFNVNIINRWSYILSRITDGGVAHKTAVSYKPCRTNILYYLHVLA